MKDCAMSKIAIIDLGGQYCHLISRRLRDLRVPADILAPSVLPEELKGYAGIVLSGGPSSVYDSRAPKVDPGALELGVPVLGICYGHQLLAKYLGASVAPGEGEFGLSTLSLLESDTIFRNTPARQSVWMSHSDTVVDLPGDVYCLGMTERCPTAAFAQFERRMFGVQFHPEVAHTQCGPEIIENFALKVCGIEPSLGITSRIPGLLDDIRTRVGDRSVFFFVSGGVDSSVAFSLCARALSPDRMLGVYIDTGLMRRNETAELRGSFARLGLEDRLRVRDESERFLGALKGVVDPEEKREIIGRTFVEIQAAAMHEYGIDGGGWLLGQGTIYPDTIESGGGTGGSAALIKTHHNRCTEIRELLAKGLVVEPLVEFYKDEVREIGEELGLEKALTDRWPFPGPGLAIRCLCNELTESQPARAVDLPVEFKEYRAYGLPVRSVGVQGDYRTYREVAALEGPSNDQVNLQHLSSYLCNRDDRFNRVILRVGGRCSAPLDLARIVPRRLTPQRLDLLREADHCARSVMEEYGIAASVWQFPVVVIPVALEQGDAIVLRPVNSVDGMTASFALLPEPPLREMVRRIEQLEGTDLIFLDCTNKPPATIEWE